MLHLHFQELVTPQLRLRRLGAEDVPVFYSRLASSQNVTKSMLWKPHASLEESAASIQKALRRLEAGESCRWAITLKTTGALIGIIDLLPRDIPKGICSFAYMLAESHWNRGYGTEAMKAVTDFGFAQCGVPCLRPTTLPTIPPPVPSCAKQEWYTARPSRKNMRKTVFATMPMYTA